MLAIARALSIVGLTIALIMFGGLAVVCVIALITHHHLNSRGCITLFGNSWICWITLQYLRLKIAEGRSQTELSA
jgi:hypothetical protein